jgi:hypothetical protein
MIKNFFLFIFSILLLTLCSSCGPGYHLRRAEHHIEKAEKKGALWTRDTVFQKMKFTIPGVEVKFTPRVLSSGSPMIFTKDSVITKVLIVKGKSGRDTIRVETKCPDQIVEKDVPVAIDNTISSNKSLWYYAGWFALVAVVFFTVGYFVRDGPPKVKISIEKPDKPPM